ncbi:mitochondrial mRNA pseudouridine synthase RPUSD3 isoform X2 [Oryctolagus cuniculus]|uniref:mitochondrial mRNA pseudouridine synthase RPUSD3 isoform X2 n=1 Tax=Oryctolagus cuniculus TaxID=9986 RepID=UPI00387937E3
MRTVPARAMSGTRALGRVGGGWRRWTGARAATRDAGFGAEARSRPPGDQPFPGLLPSETLSREQLVDVLRAAVVDRKGPLVTLNKPQGLPVTGKPGELTLHSVLPELSRSLGLGESEFQVVQAPGKEISGLVLLSSCAQTASRLHEFFTHSRRAHRPTATYWAVTDGIPATPEGEIQAALKLERVDGVDLVLPVKPPSRRDVLASVKRTLSHFRVVATGSGCALVQLQPLTGPGWSSPPTPPADPLSGCPAASAPAPTPSPPPGHEAWGCPHPASGPPAALFLQDAAVPGALPAAVPPLLLMPLGVGLGLRPGCRMACTEALGSQVLQTQSQSRAISLALR